MALFTTPGASLGGIPGSAALARLLVVISGNTQGLVNSLSTATSSLNGFQSNANALGNTMTRSITLPTLALGGAVVKVAGDFEASMARVAGLTQLVGNEADKARTQILDLVASDDIIAGPKDLADALYFAASAGLNNFSQAMEVVKLSAQGASVGMGDAADISRVLISALNAFEDQGLTAAEAMDALTAAVKEGTAEPDELAIALGRLLPIANQVGLSFQETVAQVAALTNIGVPTRVATTALRALFGQFLAPTIKAKENLDQLGISYDELQSAIRAGPLVAFKLLNDAAKGNDQIIRNLIPQIRGLTAFFGLSGERGDESARALNAVRNSAGSLRKVLDQFKETPFFRFQNAINELQIAAIEMGGAVLPIFNQLVSILGDIGQGLQAIPKPLKAVAAGFLAVLAAAGPALKIFASLQSTSGVFLGSLSSMSKGFLVMAASTALAVGALGGFADGQGSVLSAALGMVASFTAISVALGLLRRAADLVTNHINSLVLELVAGLTGGQIAAIAGGITLLIGAFVLAARAAGRVSRETAEFGTALKDSAVAGENFTQFFRRMKEEVDEDIAKKLERIAKAAGLLGKIPVREGIPTFIHAIGSELSFALDQLSTAGTGPGVFGDLEDAIPVLKEAAENGTDLGIALKRAGLNSDRFNKALKQFGRSGATGETDVLAENVDVLAKSYANAIKSQKQFVVDQAASIRAHTLEEQGVRDLADEYGVSYEFMQGKLQEFGVSATGLAEDNKQIFLQEAGLVEKTTGRIIAARTEMREAEAEIVAKRQEALAGSISFFEKIEDLSKASANAIIEDSNKVLDAYKNFATNTRDLLARGLDPGALQFLVDQGPEAVAAFVKLSDDQLRAWETNFAAAMGAGDAVVLNEGKHLQTKGNAMISGFAESILANKNLPVGATQQIMNAVTAAVSSGALAPKALPMIQEFARQLGANKNIPKNKIGELVVGLVNELKNKPKFADAGRQALTKFANGLAEKIGLTKAQANAVVRALVDPIRKARDSMFLEGAGATSQFARGIRQQTGLVQSAGVDVGNQVVNGVSSSGLVDSLFTIGRTAAAQLVAGLNIDVTTPAERLADRLSAAVHDAMRNSPNYFTYYLGQDLVKQLGEGIDSQDPKGLLTGKFSRTGTRIPRAVGAHTADKRNVNFDLDVRIDRRRHARDVDYELVSRGL